MRSSIHDVAKRAGVSISTVSRVLNRSANVKEDKVKAVMEAVEYLEYEPNQFGRGLVKQTSNTLGIYFPHFSDYVFDNAYTLEFLKGVSKVISDYDYSLLLINENEDYDESNKPQFEEYIIQKRIDGLLLSSVPEGSLVESSLINLLDQKYPVAYVGKRLHKYGINVYAQYENYMPQMFKNLYHKGHREILVFLLIDQLKMFSQVEKTVADNCPDLNIYVNVIPVEKKYNIKSLIINGVKEYVYKKGCTAICSGLMEHTSIILGACNEMQLSVPEEVSIISVEHKKGDGQLLYPSVNAFYVPALEMGAELTRMLLDKLNGEKILEHSREFETPYIYRKSVKKLE